MRHAKSSWGDADTADHDRPLNKRGKLDAPAMGEMLRAEGLVPDWIVSSTAKRARSTARRVAKACGYDAELVLSAELYGAGISDYLTAIAKAPASAECILVVSHNPGSEEMIAALCGELVEMPTAAVAQINLKEGCWNALKPDNSAELVRIWRPKEVADSSEV